MTTIGENRALSAPVDTHQATTTPARSESFWDGLVRFLTAPFRFLGRLFSGDLFEGSAPRPQAPDSVEPANPMLRALDAPQSPGALPFTAVSTRARNGEQAIETAISTRGRPRGQLGAQGVQRALLEQLQREGVQPQVGQRFLVYDDVQNRANDAAGARSLDATLYGLIYRGNGRFEIGFQGQGTSQPTTNADDNWIQSAIQQGYLREENGRYVRAPGAEVNVARTANDGVAHLADGRLFRVGAMNSAGWMHVMSLSGQGRVSAYRDASVRDYVPDTPSHASGIYIHPHHHGSRGCPLYNRQDQAALQRFMSGGEATLLVLRG
ncbi:MAG: hypothetical protein AAFV36_06305 [Myxococcota bacterium]